ncbi:WbqC family protein [Lewinella sp. IMCC34191]|uniref:WbqC family protein n=1 Tax=Lewinella sp. IMCC34191 TaxID=2259172 RepID=UPI000E23C8B6|nr:WbqC family protein [Lewinella sp. IMCC34191]
MQPYLFPYPGYFQLVMAADRFIFYDDVQYINDGWINRNRLPDGWFTVPVAADHMDTPIKDRRIAEKPYARFRKKWLKRFDLQYRRAPFYESTRQLIDRVFVPEPTHIGALAARSVELTAEHLEIAPVFGTSSSFTYDRNADTQDKLLSLLNETGTEAFVNPEGGRHLYEAAAFNNQGISLRFLHSTLDYSGQAGRLGYSIIHLLAHHEPEVCRRWLTHYTLTSNNQHEPATDQPAENRSLR